MKVTDAMRRCLDLLHRHGEGIRFRHGPRAEQWSWRINGVANSYSVDRCIRAGLVVVADQDRIVLSGLGQRVLGNH